MARIEKTIFISYRRADVYTALAVYQDLTSKGYDVFFDYTSIPSGDFEQIIVSNIKARAHFVLILTPTALDRCSEPGDWLRREIETAIDEQRNIIPLFFKGFNFGSPSVSEKLTGKFGNLNRFNGLNVHEDYFQAAMDRLSRQFLSVPLDAVIHPVSREVRKVVKEEQVAANKALGIVTEKAVSKPSPAPESSSIDESAAWLGRLDEEEVPAKPDKARPGVGSKRESPHVVEFSSTTKTTHGDHVIYTFGESEFVKVLMGKFLMGSGEKDKQSYDDEKPQHKVDIPYDYYMARFPVINGQYAAYMKAKGIPHPVRGWEKKHDHPVANISWDDAMVYCRWLDEFLKSELPSGLVLRLPTEAEWEKAARGEKGLIYPWGDTFDKKKCNTAEGERGHTTPVGAYSPQGDSLYGCADMSGNVWEWTHSLFKPYPYEANDGRESEKASGNRALRGGSFNLSDRRARCASRLLVPIGYFYFNLGFRVVVAPPIP